MSPSLRVFGRPKRLERNTDDLSGRLIWPIPIKMEARPFRIEQSSSLISPRPGSAPMVTLAHLGGVELGMTPKK